MKVLKWALLVGVVIQLVPFGHNHANPPVAQEPAWNSPATRELIRRACYDCHSNESVWPWYSNIAPISWLIQRDVNGGRRHLNFSEWDRTQRHSKDVASQVKMGDMPPWFYLPLHPTAKLSATEVQALAEGAEKTLVPQAPPEQH